MQYDETIPWEEGKSLPNFKDLKKVQQTVNAKSRLQ